MASILDDISSVNMLESLITRDSRWEWILDEWESSSDEQLLGVAFICAVARADLGVGRRLGHLADGDAVLDDTSTRKSAAW